MLIVFIYNIDLFTYELLYNWCIIMISTFGLQIKIYKIEFCKIFHKWCIEWIILYANF